MFLIEVDQAIEVFVNVAPLIGDSDFKTIDETIAYNESGMDLNWNFITTAGVVSQTNVTPTTGGDYDWAHVGNGMYKIEIPASGGASINNDAEGTGWFSGVCTSVLPWISPRYTFVKANVSDSLINGSDYLQTDAMQIEGVDATDQINAECDTALSDYDPPTNAEMEARTLPTASYFDPATDAVANVTLVGTTTTNTDMRGTDNAATAAKLLAYVQLLARSDAAIETDNATELTEINANGGSGAGDYSAQTDSGEAVRDHVGDGTNLTEAGGDGDHLTAINLPDQTMNITGSITGNVSGSVGSVTGAVGSVTGNVGGNVTGSVGSVLGGINTTGGVITTLDGLDTAQDSQHSATQSAISGLNDFNPATDTVAHVTLVDTTTTNTDMRGTDGANTVVPPSVAEFNARTLLAAQYGTATNQTNIETDTQDIQARIPAALVGGLMSSDVTAISTSTDAADKLEASAETIEAGAAIAGTLSTTQMTTNLTEATNDHYNGRVIIWTSGVLIRQATDITDYDGASKMLTYTAVTEAPSATDTFVIV